MKILVTGFDPFGKESINPAIEAVKRLDDEIANAQIIKLEIPTIAHTSLAVIKQAIEDHEPDMVLSIGQAGGRSDITVERIGINIDDYRIADNGHQQPIDEKSLRMVRMLILLICRLRRWSKAYALQVYQPLYLIQQGPLCAIMLPMAFAIY